MNSKEDIARLLTRCAALMTLLREVEALCLPQGCIAAGMVRNAVWDALHDRAPTLHPRSDVDVIYFQPAQLGCERESESEGRLHERQPAIPWQVRNQARMHLRNGDPAYTSSSDALCYFPETATAISAHLRDGELVIHAPLGIDDLLALRVRPTPNFRHKPALYRARLATKDWAERWPRLRFEGA